MTIPLHHCYNSDGFPASLSVVQIVSQMSTSASSHALQMWQVLRDVSPPKSAEEKLLLPFTAGKFELKGWIFLANN